MPVITHEQNVYSASSAQRCVYKHLVAQPLTRIRARRARAQVYAYTERIHPTDEIRKSAVGRGWMHLPMACKLV